MPSIAYTKRIDVEFDEDHQPPFFHYPVVQPQQRDELLHVVTDVMWQSHLPTASPP